VKSISYKKLPVDSLFVTFVDRSVTGGRQGRKNFPGAKSTWGRRITAGGDEWLRAPPKSPINVTSTFFNTVHLLPKDLRFRIWGRQTCFLPRALSNHDTRLFVETSYFDTNMCKFESKQKEESRALSTDSSKFYNKPRALNYPKSYVHKSTKTYTAFYISCVRSYIGYWSYTVYWSYIQTYIYNMCIHIYSRILHILYKVTTPTRKIVDFSMHGSNKKHTDTRKKTSIDQWRSQPKNLGGVKKLGGQNVWFKRITLFCLEKRLSMHELTIFSKNLGVAWPFDPPGTPMA